MDVASCAKVASVPLTHGLSATIDVADLPLVAGHSWQATRNKKDNTWYAQSKVGRMHRVILGMPDCHIDHIDGNGLNNRRSNLRLCDHSQNQANSKPRSGCTSQYKGVHLDKRTGRWIAKIRVTKGKGQKVLGSFVAESDAAKAYNNEALKVYGEFARLNDV